MVVLAVGFRPNTGLGAGKLEAFPNGAFLKTKKEAETSIKDVYAIGDCDCHDNSINDTNYIALASNALRSGIVTCHNARS